MSFSIKPNSIKYLETDRGVAFSADLLEDGSKVGTVHNNGRGGATYIDLNEGLGGTVHARLEDASNDSGGTEWYLEELMDAAENITVEDKEEHLSNTYEVGKYIFDNMKDNLK